jgi:hypothetical protein
MMVLMLGGGVMHPAALFLLVLLMVVTVLMQMTRTDDVGFSGNQIAGCDGRPSGRRKGRSPPPSHSST